MAKQLQLTVPTPCHEDWDSMTPVHKGKFCGSCQKQVVDFSDMSDRQVADFFKKPSTGSVCGRFMTDQLDRSIEIPRKRIPWVKYFFQFALPAFLLSIKSSSAKSQGKVIVNNKNPSPDKVLQRSAKIIGDTIFMAEVVVSSVAKYQTKGKVINSFSMLQAKVAGPVITVVPDKPVDICNARDLSVNAVTTGTTGTELQGRLGGVVIVVGGASVVKRTRVKEKKLIPLLNQILKDTIAKSFKVFPNPVIAGSSLNIEYKQVDEGDYIIQIVNQSGQSIHQQKIWIDAKLKFLSVDVPYVSAGSYFLVLINKKTGKKFSEKIIIQ